MMSSFDSQADSFNVISLSSCRSTVRLLHHCNITTLVKIVGDLKQNSSTTNGHQQLLTSAAFIP